jgi:hypothetical protein
MANGLVITRVRMNGRGAAEILNSGGVRAGITPFAEQVLGAAQSIAPVESGAYRASLAILQDSTDRVAVRVVADVPHSYIVEARHGTLARALGAAG